MNARRFLQLAILFTLATGLLMPGCNPATPTATTAPSNTPTFTPTPTITSTPTVTYTPTVGPGGFPRRFHVEGNAFVDQFGQKMVFRGLNMAAPMQMTKYPAPSQVKLDEHFFQVMASWGATVVRIPIEPYDIHRFGWPAILNVLDQTVAWAGENKLYVDFSFHVCGSITQDYFPVTPEHYTTTVEEYKDFWNRISKHYANNDVVAFYELFNEPYYPDNPTKNQWLDLKGLAEQGIASIRANDPDTIILVGGLYWAYDLSYVEDAPVEGDNIGYATHVYPQNADQLGKSWDIAFGNLSKTYPVFATEFNYTDNYNDDMGFAFRNRMIGSKPYNQAVIDYLEDHRISWMVWCFDNFIYIPLLSDNNYTPNKQGEYFRSRLLYEQEGSPKPRPAQFTKRDPADRIDNVIANPILIWSDSYNLRSYEYCLDTNDNDFCDTSWISTDTNRKVALTGLTVGTTYYWQVRAINGYGFAHADGGSWNSFTVSNAASLSLGRPARASSIEYALTSIENAPLYAPEFAVDGDHSTRWSSAFSDPQWLQVDLGQGYDIHRIVIYWELSFSTAYQIQVSDDATNWTTVYSTLSGNGETDDLTISGSGRYVRIYCTKRNVFPWGDSYGHSIREFEVFGAQP